MNYFIFFLQYMKKNKFFNLKNLTIPILILIILSMIILPLPSFILDFFFTFNITLSIVILVSALLIKKTLDFSTFPTILLFSTLLRLVLNIASTRVILLYGHNGFFSAGHVIEAFGNFLVGGNFVIGIVVFIILVIINFMVITAGSGRVAEVSARFYLDAMPGKQMSIDSDINAGLIQEKEAKIRRIQIEKEAEFYGSMDGASKFVRGDAIAGIIIMFVNLIGGLCVGIIQHNMIFLKAVKVYSLLTIGDGLIAQIPALLISIASGVIVTRVSSDKENIGDTMVQQIFKNSQVILLSGVILGVFSLVPGMPNLLFLFFSIFLLFLSFFLFKEHSKKKKILKFLKKEKLLSKEKFNKLSWKDVFFEKPITIEFGNRIYKEINIDISEKFFNNLQKIRKFIMQDFGFLIPDFYIRQNSYLQENSYRIFIKGVEISQFSIFLDKICVLNSLNFSKEIKLIEGIEPILNRKIVWIDKNYKDYIYKNNFLVLNAFEILMEHFQKVVSDNISQFLSIQETQNLLDRVYQDSPKIVECLVPNKISLVILQKILKSLLSEKISIRNIYTILETLIENFKTEKKLDIDFFVYKIRISLKDWITQKFFPKQENIQVIGLHHSLEELLLTTKKDKISIIEPKLLDKLVKKITLILKNNPNINYPVVFLVHPELRSFLYNFFKNFFSNIVILSFLEISDNKKVNFSDFINL